MTNTSQTFSVKELLTNNNILTYAPPVDFNALKEIFITDPLQESVNERGFLEVIPCNKSIARSARFLNADYSNVIAITHVSLFNFFIRKYENYRDHIYAMHVDLWEQVLLPKLFCNASALTIADKVFLFQEIQDILSQRWTEFATRSELLNTFYGAKQSNNNFIALQLDYGLTIFKELAEYATASASNLNERLYEYYAMLMVERDMALYMNDFAGLLNTEVDNLFPIYKDNYVYLMHISKEAELVCQKKLAVTDYLKVVISLTRF